MNSIEIMPDLINDKDDQFNVAKAQDSNCELINNHFVNMSISASYDLHIEFLNSFLLLKECFEFHFELEEIYYLNESNKINFFHKLIHKIFLKSLCCIEKSIVESKEKRFLILKNVRNWYFDHMNDFK
ncbi:MAG: hypothetical protein COA79_07690 [Planctomycetota bacterium]|nr:MAG: hypothetical protein COA79_07690 [Planctomycetota bacterium]